MLNPFALFNLPIDYQVDEALLKSRYLQLQKQFHPDNFIQHSAQQQRLAMQKSAEINDAWQALRDPILRAEAVMAWHLGEVTKTEMSHDMAFLMQQIQWRESLMQDIIWERGSTPSLFMGSCPLRQCV